MLCTFCQVLHMSESMVTFCLLHWVEKTREFNISLCSGLACIYVSHNPLDWTDDEELDRTRE